MIEFEAIRISIAKFLQFEIFAGFDLWTFVHLFSGFILMFLIFKLFEKISLTRKYFVLFLFLVLYELFELFMFSAYPKYFLSETMLNQIVDVFMGLIGAVIYKLVYK